jgi:hypothetical protein
LLVVKPRRFGCADRCSLKTEDRKRKASAAFHRTLFVRWFAVQLLKVLPATSAPALIGVVGNEQVRKFR